MSMPLIWASPVMPGSAAKTASRLRRSISSVCVGRHGRGPTRLISPCKTFQSCGSSSSLNFRKVLPTAVTAFAGASCEGKDGVPGHRSQLVAAKEHAIATDPGLGKDRRPGDDARIASMQSNKTGDVASNIRAAATRSKARFSPFMAIQHCSPGDNHSCPETRHV